MNKKEEELLSMHYQIEKTDIKQQRFEDQLRSISNDLKRSKKIRNYYFGFIIFLILFIAGGSLFLMKSEKGLSLGTKSPKKQDEIKQLLIANDSLQRALDSLKRIVQNQEKGLVKDSIEKGFIDSDTILESLTIFSKDSLDSKKKTKKKKLERKHCYIHKAYRSNDAIFLEVDVIEYYEGKKAVKKAREYGKAEYDIDNNGDTLYFLYNNYYIHNQSSRSVILELDENARVKIENINQISNGFSLKALQKIILDRPILILEVDDGIVHKIVQQKLP